MNIWTKLAHLEIPNKERFQQLFSETIEKIQKNKFTFFVGESEQEDHYVIIEEDRLNSLFVHIVPKQAYDLFKEMQEKAPQSFLGFSIHAGSSHGKDIRVSCFGIECSFLGKSFYSKKKESRHSPVHV